LRHVVEALVTIHTWEVVNLLTINEIRNTDLDERLIIEDVQLYQCKPTQHCQMTHNSQLTAVVIVRC